MEGSMALYEYKCNDCGEVSEILVFSSDDKPECKKCGSSDLEKLLSNFAVAMAPGKSNAAPSCPSGGCCPGAGGCGMS